MSLDLDRIKTMDKSTKHCVYGYIRECQNLFCYNDNPYYNLYGNIIIISSVLLFYDEPDIFEINDKRTFKYSVSEHGTIFHIFSKKVIERKHTNNYKWKIKTNDTFSGTFGVIDIAKIDKIENGKFLWCIDHRDFAIVGSKLVCWSAAIFNGTNTGSFVEKEDIITIELDFNKDIISFTSQKSKETKIDKLKPGIKSVKFIAEFDIYDCEMSFVE